VSPVPGTPGASARSPRPVGPVLVTGANGFIGRALSEHLAGLGVEVRGVDVVGDATAGIRAGSTTEPGSWTPLLDGVDTVVHTAAIVSNVVPAARMHAVNVEGTGRVLAAATAAGVRRFVHLSSVVVHGFDLPAWVDESRPMRPNGDAYVDTKVASERLVVAAGTAGDIEVVVLRPGDVYGPGSRPWVVLPLRYLRARQAVLPARGRGILSHVHVDTLLDGITRAIATPSAAGGVFHLTDGVATTCAEYFGRLGAMVGTRPRHLPTPAAVAAAGLVGGVQRAFGRSNELGAASMRLLARTGSYRIDHAREVLGFEPAIDLDTGMADVEAWAATQGLLGSHRRTTATVADKG
jgi:2-alkyl-3-oxoalkanoate reductase